MLSGAVRCLLRCSNTAFSESAARFLRIAQRSVYTVNGVADKSPKEADRLFTKIHLEARGHDKAVLNSYGTFLQTACHHLSIKCGPVQAFPYVKWIIPLLRSKFAHKKYKLHYETRTHIRRMTVEQVTGSTASTFLEYAQRNVPEGVAMKVTYEEALALPKMISKSLLKERFVSANA